MGVDHYENFPVASLLCPPALRPPIRAIYGFARTADDLADEGDASPADRLDALREFGSELQRAVRGEPPGPRWPRVFGPLGPVIAQHRLPPDLLAALLSAFEQDVTCRRYPDRAALLDYCSRSANPVGRLLLHLYGLRDAGALARSDDICTALQLINFWQDLGVDASRGRVYLPATDCRRHGFEADALVDSLRPDAAACTPAFESAVEAAVAEACDWAEQLMRRGAPLVHEVPGRAGWELRGVVQGGLRIVEKIRAIGHRTRTRRPTLDATDLPRLAWRSMRMTRAAVLAAVPA